MKTLIAFTLCLSVATPVAALDPMSAEAFDAYTTGKTFSFGTGVTPYGAEQYLPNRRVIWSFLDGQCRDGTWYAEEQNICFVYENRDTPQCWQFFQTPSGLRAQFQGADPSAPLYQLGESSEPLFCLGPEVGA